MVKGTYMQKDVATTKTQYYIHQLEQLFTGGSWQGETFTEKLKNVNEELAFEQPVKGVHSIAEIVWHCIYWRTVFIKCMEGNFSYRNETIEELNFLDISALKQKGWKKIIAEFNNTRQRLIDLLGSIPDDFLLKEYRESHNLEYLAEGIVQHDLYHLGQIGLVKKILAMRKKKQSILG